jgi:hypothetical protein
LLVDVEAPVGTIEKALQVTINNYQLGGYTYFSNAGDAVIPANLAGIILSVGGLDNLPRMRPEHSHGFQPPGALYSPGPVVGQAITQRAEAGATGHPAPHANIPNSGPLTNALYPGDIWSQGAYDYDALENVGHCCNPNNDAGGSPPEASIGIAAFGNLHYDSGTSTYTDVAAFASGFSLVYNVTAIPIDGGPSTCVVGNPSGNNCDADSETALDAEWSTATSQPNSGNSDSNHTAHVYVYEGGGSFEDVYAAMLNAEVPSGPPLPTGSPGQDYAKIFSTSWSCTEIHGCTTTEMAARDGYFSAMVALGWTLMTASGDRGATDDCSDISVSFPASDPNVIGVGGTTLTLNLFTTSSDDTFSSEVAWTGGTKTSPSSCSKNNGGSGGGCSVIYTTTDAPWQVGNNGSCGSARSVPDIALNANTGQNYYFNGLWGGIGGTSISSPMLAGFFAQEGAYQIYLNTLNSTTYLGLGNGNPYLYTFGPNASYAPHYPFYDVTSGNNSNDVSLPLVPVSAGCGIDYFCAGPGYDSVTGWGSANMLQLAWAINGYNGYAVPTINFSAPPPIINVPPPGSNKWYATSQTVSWSITDNGTNGIAGYSAAWDSLPPDSSSPTTPDTPWTGTSPVDSFYTGPLTPNSTSGSLYLDNNGTGHSGEGCHTAHVRPWDNGGATSDQTYGPVCFDDVKPNVICGSSDGVWHATNVSIHCTASDPNPNGPGSGSGLSDPTDDDSFYLTTTVLTNHETNNACTTTLEVSDKATNSTEAGPICGNMVDMEPPLITITQPAATTYTHSGTLTLNYTVSDDGGSGVKTFTPKMNGSSTFTGGLANGTVINLLTALPLGPNTFSINATDNVNNSDSESVTFTIIVTPQSIINDVNEFETSHVISRMAAGLLLGPLNAALREWNAGVCGPAINSYDNFINLVHIMQTVGAISRTDASILIGDANYLISHCP